MRHERPPPSLHRALTTAFSGASPACAGAQRSRRRGPAGQGRGFARDNTAGGQRELLLAWSVQGYCNGRAPLLLFIPEHVANDTMEERLLPNDVYFESLTLVRFHPFKEVALATDSLERGLGYYQLDYSRIEHLQQSTHISYLKYSLSPLPIATFIV